MTIYRTLEPISYLDDGIIRSVGTGRLVDLDEDQAAALADSIVEATATSSMFVTGALHTSSTSPALTIHGATAKEEPDDEDEIGLTDSDASFRLKKLTWADLKKSVYEAADVFILTLNDSITDITTAIDDAVADGKRHIVVPYRATAWPALTTIVLTDTWLEFQRGARISFDHDDIGIEMTNCRLTNASFTSIHTGPSSSADATSATYAYPARKTLLHDNCIIDGSYYHEYATMGIDGVGAHLRYNCPLHLAYIRHQRGWGSSIHHSGEDCWDVKCNSPVYIHDSDRGLECEDGCYDIVFSAGGILYNIYPAGYTGQGSAVTYENYTFVLDGHSHQNQGYVWGIVYGGSWYLDTCGTAVTFVRSTGSNDGDLPQTNRVEDVRIVGRAISTGYPDITLQGRDNRVDKVHFEVGGGIAGTSFHIQGEANSRDNVIGELTFEEAAAKPIITENGTGLRIGNDPLPLPDSLNTGKFISLGNRAIGTAQLSNNTLRTTPVYIPHRISINQLGAETTIVGDSGSVLRIGIFTDKTGLPNTPIADVTVATDGVAIVMANLGATLILDRGWYHIGGAPQNAPSVAPTMRCVAAPPDDNYLIFNPGTTSVVEIGYSKGSVTGALSTFGTSIATTNVAPRIWARLV